MLKKIFRLLIGLAFAGLFIWLMARQLNPQALQQALLRANFTWLALSLSAFVIGYACRIARWRLMLQADNPAITWLKCAGPLLASFATNNVLPFRAGDIARAFAFNTRLGVSAGIVVATLFVERLLDLLMVLLLLSVTLALFGLHVSRFAAIGSATLMVIASAILLLLLWPQLFTPLVNLISKLVTRLSPTTGKRLSVELYKSLTTLKHLAQGAMMLRLLLWSLLAWLAEGGLFWSAAYALDSLIYPQAAWLALPIGTLATLIPSTPGYVGTFDYFTVQAMTALGNNPNAAVAYALLVHLLLWLPPTLLGGVYLLRHAIKQRCSITPELTA